MIIKVLIKVLKETKPRTKNQAIAKGLYKYPETWSEFWRYLRLRANGWK
jgi:hypothetical protein